MRYMTVANKETLDSREVAKMVKKDHAHLCRDIKGYIEVIGKNPTLDSSNYFIPTTYKQAGNGKEVTRMVDEDGKSFPVKKPKPRYLQVVEP